MGLITGFASNIMSRIMNQTPENPGTDLGRATAQVANLLGFSDSTVELIERVDFTTADGLQMLNTDSTPNEKIKESYQIAKKYWFVYAPHIVEVVFDYFGSKGFGFVKVLKPRVMELVNKAGQDLYSGVEGLE